MQNFFSNLAPKGGEGGVDDGIPWWMKYAGKGAGIGGGIVAIFFGVWCLITISPMCIVAGIWQICAGFILIVIEAPFCCMFLDFVQQISGVVEGRPVWQKAAVYLILGIPPIAMCIGLCTIIGSGMIIACAAIYGMQVIGKKASREEMLASASVGRSDTMDSGLIENIHGQDVATKGNP